MKEVIGKKVSIKWNKDQIGIIVNVKEVPEQSQKLESIRGRLVIPAHNEYLVDFYCIRIWCMESELRFVN